MSNKVINVLQVLIGGKTFTGVASYLYQQYLHIDREKVHYDFLFCRENAMEMVKNEEVFKTSRFITLNAVKKNSSVDYIRFIKGLKRTVNLRQYDYIVVNTSIVELVLACLIAVRKNKGIKVVAHAHNTEIVIKRKSFRYKYRVVINYVENVIRRIIRKQAHFLFACSKEAGITTFGEKAIQSRKFSIIRNAIDIDSFLYDEGKRNTIRKTIGVSDGDVVYGNIGSLCLRKNQSFLLKVFKEISLKEPQAKLWIIGNGELLTTLKKEAIDLRIDDKVLFLGQRTDVSELMQGMDCFIFTTISEGLGIVAVESQAAGLPTIVSNGVPDDVVITDMCLKLDLEEGVEEWAKDVMCFRKKNNNRTHNYNKLAQAGYDIKESAKLMLNYYK